MVAETIEIRSARNEDTSEIVNLVKNSLLEFDEVFNPETSENDLVDIEATYVNNSGSFDVAEADGKIIGTIGLLKIDEHTCKLRKMYVAKPFRNQGLGKKLVTYVIQRATDLGYSAIILETVHTMKSAIHLYQRCGFTVVPGMNASSPRCDIVMKKNLRS